MATLEQATKDIRAKRGLDVEPEAPVVEEPVVEEPVAEDPVDDDDAV